MTMQLSRWLPFTVGASIVLLGACEPTFSDAAVATIENDTAQKVELRLCSDDHCKKEFYPPRYELAQGNSAEVNVSKSGVPSVYLVSVGDRRIGCLPIVVNDPAAFAKLNVSVSEQLPCSDNAPKEWPVASDAP